MDPGPRSWNGIAYRRRDAKGVGSGMLIGYARVGKADGSQVLDLQRDALKAARAERIYEDRASGKRDERPGLTNCLMALREGDTLLVWKLDRLGRDLHHLVGVAHELQGRGIGLKVLTGQGAEIDTTTAAGRMVFGIFAAPAEFERALIVERTKAGLAAARARGRRGGRPSKRPCAGWRPAASGRRPARRLRRRRKTEAAERPGVGHERGSRMEWRRERRS